MATATIANARIGRKNFAGSMASPLYQPATAPPGNSGARRYLNRLGISAFPADLPRTLPCVAQTLDNALRDITQWKLLIEDLDKNSQNCGITTEKIRNAVLYPVSSAQFKITDAGNSRIYVKALSLFLAPINVCVT